MSECVCVLNEDATFRSNISKSQISSGFSLIFLQIQLETTLFYLSISKSLVKFNLHHKLKWIQISSEKNPLNIYGFNFQSVSHVIPTSFWIQRSLNGHFLTFNLANNLRLLWFFNWRFWISLDKVIVLSIQTTRHWSVTSAIEILN